MPGKISNPGPGPNLLLLSCGGSSEAVDDVSSESLPEADPSFSAQLLLLDEDVSVLAAADGELSSIRGCISLGASARWDLLLQVLKVNGLKCIIDKKL